MSLKVEVVDSRPDRETGSNPIFGTKRGTDGMVRGVAGPVDFVSNIERWSGPREDAKHIALRALTGAFIERDPSVVETLFCP